MVGLVLALAVIAIIVTLVGQWIAGIVIGALAVTLSVVWYGRRAAASRRP